MALLSAKCAHKYVPTPTYILKINLNKVLYTFIMHMYSGSTFSYSDINIPEKEYIHY